MSQAIACRVVVESRPRSGAWNMAVDEALLEAALDRGECLLRFYRWDAATVSLGYFQPSREMAAIPGFASLPAVRRLSGGGAILHHHELTYSCVLPATHPLAQSPSQLYEQIHARLLTVFGRQGVTAALRGRDSEEQNTTFLCFGRGDPRDIVCQGHKIVGSAQRRRRGAVLQHGSILWARSPHAPEFPGIVDLCPSILLEKDWTQAFAWEAAGVLASRIVESELTEQELARASVLEHSKYSILDWQRARETLGKDRA